MALKVPGVLNQDPLGSAGERDPLRVPKAPHHHKKHKGDPPVLRERGPPRPKAKILS